MFRLTNSNILFSMIDNGVLNNTVRGSVSADSYYKGNSNNYVLFSGMLWRVVKVNEDGTVKIILNEPVSNLRINYTTYKDSNVDTWLNEVFYKALHNPDDYLVKSDYCVGTINSINDENGYCDEKITSKIGLLDVNEYVNVCFSEGNCADFKLA